MSSTPVLKLFCRESYNDATDLYKQLKSRGMGLVTMTDHDAIDAGEALRRYPDFFLSEEVTVQMPSGTEIHLGVYHIRERDHLEIQRRRNDFLALVMYLTERKLFFSVNHVFSGLTGRRELQDFDWFASYVPGMETRNGQMCVKANAAATELAERFAKVAIAGSDAHAPAGAGLTYTEVRGARTVDEFFSGLLQGRGTIHGAHGAYFKLLVDVFSVTRSLLREKPWTLGLSPLATLIPLVTAGHWLNEKRFSRKWSRILETAETAKQPLWNVPPYEPLGLPQRLMLRSSRQGSMGSSLESSLGICA